MLMLLIAFHIISFFRVILEFPHHAVSVVGFTPILLGLTCMLRVCVYREGAMEREKRGVGNISFRWWRKLKCPERTTCQPQVTDNLLTYRYSHWWETHWATMAPIHLGLNEVWTEVDPKGHDCLLEARRLGPKPKLSAGITRCMCYPLHCPSLPFRN